MKTKILTKTILSLSLLMGTLSADTICTGKHCLIDLSKLSPKKTKEVNNMDYQGYSFKSKNLKSVEENVIDEEYVLEEGVSFTMNANEIETIVFPHEKYVMTKAEIETYESEYIELIVPNEKLENKIIKQLTPLPESEYFCENHTKPVYNNLSDTYECA
jgi:hypothetical protein